MATFTWTTVPSLLTPRLALRALGAEDRHDLFAIYGDPEVMRYASDPAFPDLSYVDQMLASVARLFQEQQSIEWGLTLQTNERVIGTCGLHSFELDGRSAEIGCLLRRSYWGQSLMREALEAVMALGFDRLGLATIRAEIDAPNTRSLALFQRLGFQQATPDSTIYIYNKPGL